MGLIVGGVRMVLEFIYTAPSCGQEDLRPPVIAKVHYLYFALILFVLTCLVITAVSLATPPIPKAHVRMQLTHTHTLITFSTKVSANVMSLAYNKKIITVQCA